MLVYSALFAKLRRIHEIMASAQSFRKVEVPRKSVAVTVFVFLALMVVILLTWQLVSPMTWERTVTATTFLTGFPTASFGRCTSEHSAVFAGISAGFIGVCLACSLFLSYKTRRISLEFAESKYVRNYSEHSSIKDIQILTVYISRGYRFYLLQLLVLGIPILIIAREDTDAYFTVFSIILFLMSFGTTGLIFLPKIMAQRKRNESSSGLPAGNLRPTTRTDPFENSVEQIRKRVAMMKSNSNSGVDCSGRDGDDFHENPRTIGEKKIEEDTMEEEKV